MSGSGLRPKKRSGEGRPDLVTKRRRQNLPCQSQRSADTVDQRTQKRIYSLNGY